MDVSVVRRDARIETQHAQQVFGECRRDRTDRGGTDDRQLGPAEQKRRQSSEGISYENVNASRLRKGARHLGQRERPAHRHDAAGDPDAEHRQRSRESTRDAGGRSEDARSDRDADDHRDRAPQTEPSGKHTWGKGGRCKPHDREPGCETTRRGTLTVHPFGCAQYPAVTPIYVIRAETNGNPRRSIARSVSVPGRISMCRACWKFTAPAANRYRPGDRPAIVNRPTLSVCTTTESLAGIQLRRVTAPSPVPDVLLEPRTRAAVARPAVGASGERVEGLRSLRPMTASTDFGNRSQRRHFPMTRHQCRDGNGTDPPLHNALTAKDNAG